MSTPKHKIFFGKADYNPKTDNNEVGKGYDFENPDPPASMDPPGWTWDSELVTMDSEIRTMDEGYTTEQLIYLLSQ